MLLCNPANAFGLLAGETIGAIAARRFRSAVSESLFVEATRTPGRREVFMLGYRSGSHSSR